MTDTASGWIMTGLTPSPLTIALVQAAATLPMVVLALPGGALADLFDRRKLMIGMLICLGLTSLALGVLTGTKLITPTRLLSLTLLAGIGNALSAPIWQAIVPELVPTELLRPVIALNGVAVNIGRVIGPVVSSLLIIKLSLCRFHYFLSNPSAIDVQFLLCSTIYHVAVSFTNCCPIPSVIRVRVTIN